MIILRLLQERKCHTHYATTITAHIGFVFEESSVSEIVCAPSFSKSSVFEKFPLHSQKPAFSNSVVKSVDGRPNRRNKAEFSNFSCVSLDAALIATGECKYCRGFVKENARCEHHLS